MSKIHQALAFALLLCPLAHAQNAQLNQQVPIQSFGFTNKSIMMPANIRRGGEVQKIQFKIDKNGDVAKASALYTDLEPLFTANRDYQLVQHADNKIWRVVVKVVDSATVPPSAVEFRSANKEDVAAIILQLVSSDQDSGMTVGTYGFSYDPAERVQLADYIYKSISQQIWAINNPPRR